jgi:hypothetical protein
MSCPQLGQILLPFFSLAIQSMQKSVPHDLHGYGDLSRTAVMADPEYTPPDISRSDLPHWKHMPGIRLRSVFPNSLRKKLIVLLLSEHRKLRNWNHARRLQLA